MSSSKSIRLAVLLSGKGSNLGAIIDAIAEQTLNAEIICVISNKANAAGLEIAQQHQINTQHLDPENYTTRDAYDYALAQCIDSLEVDFVVLAGFMRILSDDFVKHFYGKLINIHPSLLPKYKGLNTHQRAIDAGEKYHGCSVHFVSAELDGGPVIAQAQCEVKQGDTSDSLKARVQQEEHKLYPKVLDLLQKGCVKLEKDTVIIEHAIKSQMKVGKDSEKV